MPKERQQKLDGALLAARYAFMPNKLRYCGGDANSELFHYLNEGESDDGLKGILGEFAAMFPYLKLIADANKIFDPFNYRVVEAYWIGNELLENVSMKDLYRHMVDGQNLKKKFKLDTLEKVFGKLRVGAKPHHSWHVLNIPKSKTHYPVEHTLETMDECRISWGKVKETKNQGSNETAGKTMIQYKPLVVEEGRIGLGETIDKEVWSEVNDQAFVGGLKQGDWISTHWGWLCDKLTETQVANLEKWTQHNLNLVNI